MPLNKKKLKNKIKIELENAISDYEDGSTDAINLDQVIDPLIDHIHEEIEMKLKDIVTILNSMNSATVTGMSAITPPGTGAAGAGVYSANTAQAKTLIAKLQADLNQAK